MLPSCALQTTIGSTGAYARAHRVSASSSSGRYSVPPTDYITSFYATLRRWQSETVFLSDPEIITNHPSYKALVSHAGLVMPLIVDELRRSPSMLVWVLDDAFGHQPYSPDDIGDFVKMADGWIAWADANEHVA